MIRFIIISFIIFRVMRAYDAVAMRAIYERAYAIDMSARDSYADAAQSAFHLMSARAFTR